MVCGAIPFVCMGSIPYQGSCGSACRLFVAAAVPLCRSLPSGVRRQQRCGCGLATTATADGKQAFIDNPMPESLHIEGGTQQQGALASLGQKAGVVVVRCIDAKADGIGKVGQGGGG